MNEPELPPELKLKLMEIEKSAGKDGVSRAGVIKASMLGAVGFALIPFFGIFLFPTWKVLLAMLVFGVAGGVLFGIAVWCRSNKR